LLSACLDLVVWWSKTATILARSTMSHEGMPPVELAVSPCFAFGYTTTGSTRR
jgi:hypothetical protein